MSAESMPQVQECRAAAVLAGRPLGQVLNVSVVDEDRFVASFTNGSGTGFYLVVVRPDEPTRFLLHFTEQASVQEYAHQVHILLGMV